MNKLRLEFDLVVVGATPGGIACAVRAAREGLTVLMTQYNHHIGGLWSNGLGAVDAHYAGRRSPVYSEICDRLLAWYRDRYGRDSIQYRDVIARSFSRYSETGPKSAADTVGRQADPGELPDRHYGRFNFEAKVAEAVFNQIVSEEPGIELWINTIPVEVEQTGRLLTAVTFRGRDQQDQRRVEASTFVDCTYEGDLLALAGARYRIGREDRSEYNELHAGRIFTSLHFAGKDEPGYPRDAVEGRLNIEPYEVISQQIFSGSTGEGDNKIQAYTFRLTLCSDPDNRVMPERPENYDRDIYLRMRNRWSLGSALPNNKLKWNTSNLPGGNWDYPDADWSTREKILKRHRDHAIGFLWFLQNDPEVPADLRNRAREFGLAKDEYEDNGHIPWEMYVREARRLIGRYVFTEADGTLGRGLNRTPIHRDSIAITDWAMDSHSVSMEMVPGSRREGKVLLTELTRPGQLPFRSILPEAHDNLLVPVCLSCTHIAWGTIRLEPTWMHISESAAFAAVLATRAGIAPANLDVSDYQRHLVENGMMVTFYNDIDTAMEKDWLPAIQFLGTKWFFADYNARANDPLDEKTTMIWSGIAADILKGRHAHLESVRWAEMYPGIGETREISAEDFKRTVYEQLRKRNLATDRLERAWEQTVVESDLVKRGEACLFFYRLLDRR